jgi:phosphatidate cytidylyltransferase
MRQRIITGIIFTLVIAAFMIPGYWSIWPPVVLFFSIALLASHELVGALRQHQLDASYRLAYGGSLLILTPLAGGWLFQPAGLPSSVDVPGSGFAAGLARIETPLISLGLTLFVMILVIMLGSIILLLKKGPDRLPDAVSTMVVIGYVVFPLSCPILLLDQVPGGWLWVVIGLATPWISDVSAFFVGSFCGRRPIVPILSPKKTVEGFFGGIAGSMLIQIVIFILFRQQISQPDRPIDLGSLLLFAMVTGAVLSLASQLGDWFASGFKRWCCVKDFGKLMPGHGGIMDRFDSAFFTLPLTLVLAFLYQVAQA